MQIRNNIWPNTEPCGTPLNTNNQRDITRLIQTRWILPTNHSDIQLSNLPEIPWLSNLRVLLVRNFVKCLGDIEIIEKVQKRATKLIISLKKLWYIERLKQLQLPTLKYRRLRGDCDMIEVFKIVHNYYDWEAAVKLNFNTFNTTRGNMYKLQKFMCHCNIRKYSFCVQVVNIWNSSPNEVVEADTVNAFKYRLDKHWSNQEVLSDVNADLTGTGSVPICMWS